MKGIRNNIFKLKRKLRKHFNKNKKQKIIFETKKEGQSYISKYHLIGYVCYRCSICSKYHISHLSSE